MKMPKNLPLWLALAVATACASPDDKEKTSQSEPATGWWRGQIHMSDSVRAPFNFEVHSSGAEGWQMTLYNGDEAIEITDIEAWGDSLKITLPVFANYLLVKANERSWQGEYVRPDAENYRLPFEAVQGDSTRFDQYADHCCDINEKWRVRLSPGTEDEDPAIAYFEQEGAVIKGSFQTLYGDYRFLEGVISGDTLKLSAFDGLSIYYFEALLSKRQRMTGMRYSGRSFSEPWEAFRDDDFALPDPDSLTHLKEGYEGFAFRFPDLEGDTVDLRDERFAGKAVIVTIMGSWCPNCMDEARYLTGLYEQYHDQGLEIVGLTFERVRDRPTAIVRAQKMVEDIGMPYPVLLAGATRDDRASEALPMLNHVMSFPTTIYLNRQHEVVRIHTGFNGPGTPIYEDFVTRNRSFIEAQLLKS